MLVKLIIYIRYFQLQSRSLDHKWQLATSKIVFSQHHMFQRISSPTFCVTPPGYLILGPKKVESSTQALNLWRWAKSRWPRDFLDGMLILSKKNAPHRTQTLVIWTNLSLEYQLGYSHGGQTTSFLTPSHMVLDIQILPWYKFYALKISSEWKFLKLRPDLPIYYHTPVEINLILN